MGFGEARGAGEGVYSGVSGMGSWVGGVVAWREGRGSLRGSERGGGH